MGQNDLGVAADAAGLLPTVEPVPVSPPDGAAIPNAEELWETLCFLGKWIERGLFCRTVTAKEALEVMAYYPGMPWNSRRWDVDHKPYAAAYYAKFPKTAAQAIETRSAMTAGHGPQDESAVLAEDAPVPSVVPSPITDTQESDAP